MLRTLTLLLFLPCAVLAQAPGKSELAPCGTLGVSDFLREYDPTVSHRSADTVWVAIQPHLLASNSGTGRLAPERFLQSFCQLNADFAETGIRFFMKNDWNLINNSGWHSHSTIPQGIEMMLSNNVPDALNSYFMASAAGNCGYNLPYAGVAISHGCSGANDHTWAHEVGHALSLPHPFIGWEGKTYSFNVPTPTWLTYDYTYFHDTLETQVPAPLDTALVELLDGSNCAIAADRICDTKPDYLSYRWDCDAQSNSLVKQKDPNEAEFYSDGTLFMSYANDKCQNRFSPQEIDIMHATLQGKRAHWVTPEMLEQPITGHPEHIKPVQDQLVPPLGALLRWKSVPHATHYLVQASRWPSFVIKQVDLVTTDTFLTAGQLTQNAQYYWRIWAFNKWHACNAFGEVATFRTTAITSASEPDADGWRCYPSPMVAGTPLTLEIPTGWLGQDASCRVFDAAGRLQWQTSTHLFESRMQLPLPSANWPPGLYRLVLTSGQGLKSCSLVLAER